MSGKRLLETKDDRLAKQLKLEPPEFVPAEDLTEEPENLAEKNELLQKMIADFAKNKTLTDFIENVKENSVDADSEYEKIKSSMEKSSKPVSKTSQKLTFEMYSAVSSTCLSEVNDFEQPQAYKQAIDDLHYESTSVISTRCRKNSQVVDLLLEVGQKIRFRN